MKTNLLESYKGRLAVSESYYAKSHNGEKLSQNKKLVVAKLLENCNKFLNESFEQSVGTQRADMGLFRKFALNLVTCAVPNLIAFDLVMVHPMSSMSGYVAYVEYVAGSNKGQTARGDVFNSPFGLGTRDAEGKAKDFDVNYTAAKVVETIAEGQTELAWGPVVEGSIEKFADGKWTAVEGAYTPKAGDKVRYEYNNVQIPQNDLPIVNAQMKSIALQAKARRIAIYYSQMAAFQAKQDYGFDLGDQLAEKAVGQLSYEIDTEITQLLIDNAAQDGDLVWSKTLPVGVSKQEHYAGFVEILEIARQKIYDRTKRFAPNYMLISSNILPILAFIPGFEAASVSTVNGPYFCGTLNSLKVYVTPNITPNTFVIGVNGDDAMSSAAVYAPYMPVVPTQLLGYSDGAMSQGFSTLYDLKILNSNLLICGRITA